jgi:hypothetical protein
VPSPYHDPLLDMFQNCNTLLNSLNVRISRGLNRFQSLDLAKSAQVTKIWKDDWSRAGYSYNLACTGVLSIERSYSCSTNSGTIVAAVNLHVHAYMLPRLFRSQQPFV